MTNICENCKHKGKAVIWDHAWKVMAVWCSKNKMWALIETIKCDDYEQNLHDNCAAPPRS